MVPKWNIKLRTHLSTSTRVRRCSRSWTKTPPVARARHFVNRIVRSRAASICFMKKQLRNLAEYLQSVREEERKRIARELHDEIGQALTGIKLVLERSVREQSGSVQASLIQALAVANELIGRVRDFALE